MRKQILSLLIALLMLFTMSGCEKSANRTRTVETVTIKYSLWGDSNRKEYTQKSIEAFEELHPEIKVKLVYMDAGDYDAVFDTWMEKETFPDVMQIEYQWLDAYSVDGSNFYDLNELKDVIDMSSYTEDCIRYGMCGSKLNALPISVSTVVPMYNKEIYERYGLEIPKNWDDLFHAAEVMSPDGIYPISMNKWQMCSLLFTYYEQISGVSAFSGNGVPTLYTEYVIDTLEMYKKMLDSKVVCRTDEYSDDMIDEGLVAGNIAWISDIDSYSQRFENSGGEIALGSFLQIDGAERFGYYKKPAAMLTISKNTEHPKESAIFLNYLLNDSTNAVIQGTEKGIPASKKAEMALMQADMLNDIPYRAKILMDYNSDNMTVKPEIIEDINFVNACVYGIDNYLKGGITEDDAAKYIIELTRMRKK